jgi:hypothetical protein
VTARLQLAPIWSAILSFPILISCKELKAGAAAAFPTRAEPSLRRRQVYEDFLALWNDADPDIPVLEQAKVEYAGLQ